MTDYLTNNHRFTLRRSWMGSGGCVNWIMLNPSTATDADDDTIRAIETLDNPQSIPDETEAARQYLDLHPPEPVLDDPTIRKCIGFSKCWGYSSLIVTNLFAFRATNPKDLIRCVQADFNRAVGKDNLEVIRGVAMRSDLVIAAWGANLSHPLLRGVDNAVLKTLGDVHCIGTTKHGHPLHPCMAGYTNAPILFSSPPHTATPHTEAP